MAWGYHPVLHPNYFRVIDDLNEKMHVRVNNSQEVIVNELVLRLKAKFLKLPHLSKWDSTKSNSGIYWGVVRVSYSYFK